MIDIDFECRSALYNIEPIGLETGLVESLSGYLIRVAFEHNISVGHLLNKMVFQKMNKSYLDRTSIYGGNRFYEGSKTINGYMENAIELARIMDKLTSRNDLSNLTLYKFKEFIPLRNLMKESLTWCPDCIGDWKKGGKVIYYPLIWFLKPVKVCKKHNCFLIDRCPVCNKTVDILRRQMILGYCPKCSSILSNDLESKRFDLAELNWELFVCENMEGLLSINQKNIVAGRFKHTFLDKLKLINEEHFSNNVASFSSYLNIPQNTLRYWLNGKSSPSLDNILNICFKFNQKIFSFLLESQKVDINILQFNEKLVINKKTKKTPKPITYDVIEKKLIELLEIETPISMTFVAKIIGRDRRVLYGNFPDICKRISKRYNDYVKEKSELRIKRLKEQIKLAFNKLKSEGVYPSCWRVEEYMNKNGVLKEKVLQDYWKFLLMQSGYEDKSRRI